jgi:hypothetical protein
MITLKLNTTPRREVRSGYCGLVARLPGPSSFLSYLQLLLGWSRSELAGLIPTACRSSALKMRPNHRQNGRTVFPSNPSSLPSLSSRWSWMRLDRTLTLDLALSLPPPNADPSSKRASTRSANPVASRVAPRLHKEGSNPWANLSIGKRSGSVDIATVWNAM